MVAREGTAMKRAKIRLGLVTLTAMLTLSASPVAQASATPFGYDRWPHPRVTYVVSGSAYYRRVFQTAIRAWNATGQFKFVPGSAAHHQVTLSTSNATNGQYYHLAGITYSTAGSNDIFTKARVILLNRNMNAYRYTYWNRVHVAEHELGHVIGLAHSRDHASVMLANNRYNGISRADAAAVRQRYRIRAGRL